MFVFVTISYMFPVEIFYYQTSSGKKRQFFGRKVSLFVTNKKKYIQKHYITLRHPVKSGHCESPEKSRVKI